MLAREIDIHLISEVARTSGITRYVIQYELKAALFPMHLECERSINFPFPLPPQPSTAGVLPQMTLLPQRHPARVMWEQRFGWVKREDKVWRKRRFADQILNWCLERDGKTAA